MNFTETGGHRVHSSSQTLTSSGASCNSPEFPRGARPCRSRFWLARPHPIDRGSIERTQRRKEESENEIFLPV